MQSSTSSTESNTYVGKPKRVWIPGPVWVNNPIHRIGDFYADLSEEDKRLARSIRSVAGRLPAVKLQSIYYLLKTRAAEHARLTAERERIRNEQTIKLEGDESKGSSGLDKASDGSGAGHDRMRGNLSVPRGSPQVRAVQLESGRRAIEHLPFSAETPPSEVVERGGQGSDNGSKTSS